MIFAREKRPEWVRGASAWLWWIRYRIGLEITMARLMWKYRRK